MLWRGKLRTNKSSRLKVHYALEHNSARILYVYFSSYPYTLNKGPYFLHLMLNTTEIQRQKLEDR